MTPQRIIVALAVLGMCRIAWFHFGSEPLHEPMHEHIDERYAPLKPHLPASGSVGYVSDEPAATRPGDNPGSEGTSMYEQAQYALAPLILRYGDLRAPLVIANLADPSKLSQVAPGLEVVAHPAPGLAVLRPR